MKNPINIALVGEIKKEFESVLKKYNLAMPESLIYGSAVNLALSFSGKNEKIYIKVIAVASVWGWLIDDYQDSAEVSLQDKIKMLDAYADLSVFTKRSDPDLYLVEVFFELVDLITANCLDISSGEKTLVAEQFYLFINSMKRELVERETLLDSEKYLENSQYSVFLPFLGLVVFLLSRSSGKVVIDNKQLIKDILKQMGRVCRITNDYSTLEREIKEDSLNIFKEDVKDKKKMYTFDRAMEIIYKESNVFYKLMISLPNEDRFKQLLSSFFWAFQSMYLINDIRDFEQDDTKIL